MLTIFEKKEQFEQGIIESVYDKTGSEAVAFLTAGAIGLVEGVAIGLTTNLITRLVVNTIMKRR